MAPGLSRSGPQGSLLTHVPYVGWLPFPASLPHYLPGTPWNHFANELFALNGLPRDYLVEEHNLRPYK